MVASPTPFSGSIVLAIGCKARDRPQAASGTVEFAYPNLR
jgi:hypothetical protein